MAIIFACIYVIAAGVPDRTGHAHASSDPNPGGPPVSADEWPVYACHSAGDHYSPLSQINRENVKQLALAWTFHTGGGGRMETNPLVVGGVVYGVSGDQRVIALDASNGHLLWKFDSGEAGDAPVRGLSMWTDGAESRL